MNRTQKYSHQRDARCPSAKPRMPPGAGALGLILSGLVLLATGSPGHAACPDISAEYDITWSKKRRVIYESDVPALADVTGHSGFNGSKCNVSFEQSPALLSYKKCLKNTVTLTGPAKSCGGGGDAGSDITQTPLYLSSAVDPNLLFVLDDSGSMQFEFMPSEDIVANGYFVFPRPDQPYGGSTYANRVPGFNDNNIHNVFYRSPGNNKVFYDPLVTYLPWVKADNDPWQDADPEHAAYNPADPNSASMDLTSRQTQSADWFQNTVNTNPADAWWCKNTCKTFWPITFYQYRGAGDRHDPESYTKYQIRGSQGYRMDLSGGGESPVSEFAWSDDGGEVVVTRSVAQERQNFANWFSYHRSRVLAARAGVGRAFAPLPDNLRVGFGAINYTEDDIDGVSKGTVIRGVRPFTGSDREDFFDHLYEHPIPAAGTPLRRALDQAGRYFTATDNRGPWGATPGSNDAEPQLACRQSYTILMTDGYWSGGSNYEAETNAARSNVDGSGGPSITGPDEQSYQYSPTHPFKDGRGETLADVAMYYWNRDLRGDLDNQVPVSELDPAFWQHMVTFGVGLGVSGGIDPGAAWDAIATQTAISWPYTNPDRGNCEGSECPARIDDLLHAALNSRGGFFSADDPEAFASGLEETLSSIVHRAAASATRVAANSVFLDTGARVFHAGFDSTDWSGWVRAYQPVLDQDSGEVSITVDWDAEEKLPDHDERNILTHEGGSGTGHGIDFVWNDLSAGQLTLLNQDEDLLKYLRGNRDFEGDGFRARSRLIGDVVNSDPVYSHQENFDYAIVGGVEGEAYGPFMAAKRDRVAALFVGANDGMLHGFNASTGVELFAYVPGSSYPFLRDLAASPYAHRYFVDGGIHVSDAYLDGAWKTVLLSGLGAGGSAVFALDVTDPASMDKDKVLWEFTDTDMGYSFGTPVIARLKSGVWAAVFGNGYGSPNGKAVLYIVNLATGNLIAKVDTGATGGNGLSSPSFVYASDTSGRYADAIYAGDLQGNVWKFQMSGNCGSQNCNWEVAFKQGNSKYPLFTARNADLQVQPITTRVDLRQHTRGGYMLLFGTGRFFASSDPANSDVQSVYGVWDNGADRVSGTDRSQLQQQSIIYQGKTGDHRVRAISDEMAWWEDPSISSARGWYFDLIGPDGDPEGERVIRPLRVWFDRLRISSYVPSSGVCSADAGHSWYMEVDLQTGARLGYGVLDLDEDGQYDQIEVNGESIDISGFEYEGAGLPAIVGEFLIFNPDDGDGAEGYRSDITPVLGRRTWREIR
jgi:type IV pilus assembly protein PilY1